MLEIIEHSRLNSKYEGFHIQAEVHGSKWLLEEALA
jgi:hypothetical protein